MPRLTPIFAILLIILPLGLQAQSAKWTDRDICRAATKTYFFLDALPADAPDQDGYFGFLSASGNLYTCAVDAPKALFRWASQTGDAMTSRSTDFRFDGDTLIVTTEVSEEYFKAN